MLRRLVWSFLFAAALGGCAGLIRGPQFPPPPPPSIVGHTLSRENAVADLQVLVHTLEDVHQNLYAVQPRDAFLAARDRMVAALPDSMTRSEWWIRLSPLVASLGDGHTNVSYPGEEVLREMTLGALILPHSIGVDDDGHVVLTAILGPANGASLGDRVLAINKLSADSLLDAWMREFSGESDLFRTASVTRAFRDLLFIHGIRAPYTLTLTSAGAGAHDVAVPGISRDSLNALVLRGRRPATATTNFAYRSLGGGVGYMNFRSMSGDLARFKTDVAAMFRQVAADSSHTLVVDLRSNGGGDSRFGDELLRYVTSTPYRMAARKEWKMSAEYRTFIKSVVRPPLSWLPIQYLFGQGRAMFSGPDGTIAVFEEDLTTPKPAEPFFTGAVCVLIGRSTFSSASDLADAVKTYRLATLIGEETGGKPNGFGEVYPFRLPHSRLAVSVSSARFVRADGDSTNHRGVVPDIPVSTTASDLRSGRDVALDQARNCPATPRRP